MLRNILLAAAVASMSLFSSIPTAEAASFRAYAGPNRAGVRFNGGGVRYRNYGSYRYSRPRYYAPPRSYGYYSYPGYYGYTYPNYGYYGGYYTYPRGFSAGPYGFYYGGPRGSIWIR